MMKVKPLNYHVPRRKASSSVTSAVKANVASPTSSLLPKRTDVSHNCYINKEYSSNRTSNNNYIITTDGSKKKVRERNSTSSTTSSYSNVISLRRLCGIGGITVITLMLLVGFIGVAGQGKFAEMDRRSESFSSQTHLVDPISLSYHQSITSLGHVVDTFAEGSDEALQQRIQTMGQYGTKYRNTSSNNYSSSNSFPDFNYSSRHQYKQELGMGTILSSHNQGSLLLSLHAGDNNNLQHYHHVNNHVKEDQSISQNNSEELENKISLNDNAVKLKRQQGRRVVDEAKERLRNNRVSKQKTLQETDWDVPGGKYASNVPHKIIYNNLNTNAKRIKNSKTVTKSHFNNKYARGESTEYRKNNIDKDKRRRKQTPTIFQNSSGSDADDELNEEEEAHDDDDDENDYTLERFIPGNSSHTSGKLRFRQSSQAEVDILDPNGSFSVSSGSSSAKGSTSSRRRQRRSVVHLYDMVVCSTGCNPLIFKGYGCYCGFLGSGLTVDGIDKCCAKHDFCYHHAKCPPLLTYFVPYYWRCDHGRPECVTDFRGWKGVCGTHLCECDRQFAECLKKFPCPRSRAMCVTSPWSKEYTDPRELPFTVGRRPPRPPWSIPSQRYAPLFHFPPPHSPLSPLSQLSPLAMEQVFA